MYKRQEWDYTGLAEQLTAIVGTIFAILALMGVVLSLIHICIWRNSWSSRKLCSRCKHRMDLYRVKWFEIKGAPTKPAGFVGRGGATKRSGCPAKGGRSSAEFATTRKEGRIWKRERDTP